MLNLKNNRSEPMGTVESNVNWLDEYGIRHVAIIPDGNRRWARERSLPTLLGHKRGLLEVMPRLLEGLTERGVHTVTVWGFSTENWNRQQAEVGYLMSIMAEFLKNQALELAKRYDARVYHLGRRDRLYPEVLAAIEEIESTTKNNGSHCWNVALDYGGQDELQRAGRRMLDRARELGPDADLNIEDFLDTAGQPHAAPDVLIRSSGEKRMSGFLPLQTTYTQLFFVEELFPEFTFDLLEDLARQFRTRKRRFGH